MTHLDHDLDLIAAHAAGDLADREQAESLVQSCPECATELREQLAIRQLLGNAPTAQLTTFEADALHRGVRSQLPAPVIDLAAARARKPLSPVWGRLTAVAAVLAGVVVIGTVFANGGDENATATTTIAIELAAGESSEDRMAAAAATTAAAETTFAAGAGQNLEDAGIAGSDEDSLDSLAGKARLLLEQEINGAAPTATTSAANLDYQAACPALAELTVVTTAEASLDERPVIILVIEEDDVLSVRAYYTDDCSEITLP